MIRLSKCSISQKEINSVVKTLKNEYLGMGTKVGVFEKNLKGFFGRDAICVSSGTAALQIAIQASNISFGDEVLVPAITYVATFQAISASGAIPIACEVNPETILIDLRDAEKKVTKRTKAIIPVHFAGNASNIKDVYLFAKKKNLIVIEDAAHAFGSYYKNKLVGSFGNISCFSFDGIKNITSGEGGCIISSNKQVNEKIRNARLLGVIGD